MYRFSAVPIKYQACAQILNKALKLVWKHKIPQISKKNLNNKNKPGGTSTADFKIYYSAVINKTD